MSPSSRRMGNRKEPIQTRGRLSARPPPQRNHRKSEHTPAPWSSSARTHRQSESETYSKWPRASQGVGLVNCGAVETTIRLETNYRPYFGPSSDCRSRKKPKPANYCATIVKYAADYRRKLTAAIRPALPLNRSTHLFRLNGSTKNSNKPSTLICTRLTHL